MNTFSTKQLDAISSLIYGRFGISIRKEKLERLEPRLQKMIACEGYSGFDDLYGRLAAGDADCLETLIKYITTCHTFFFREPDHFRLLVSFLNGQPNKNFRIWCAACSTGEEPYSVAMTLLDSGIDNFHIIASDINKKVLAYFNRGIYHENRLNQVPDGILQRYFTRVDDSFFAINRNLRSYISIKDINLMETVRFPTPFDCVFCRNVFIYFDEQSRKRAVDTIVGNLKIGGLFFIGHAEVLLCQPENLKKVGSSVYRRLF